MVDHQEVLVSSATKPSAGPAAPSTLVNGATKVSYASIVCGTNGSSFPPRSSTVPVEDKDIVLSVKDGVRSLRTSGKFRAKLCAPLKKALVIRLLGKSVGIQYLYNRLKALWRPEGRLRMVDLDNEIFLASFENSLDYDHALTGGPWLILDHYLVVHTWDPSFRASSNLPPKMVVWIRFPRLPYQYYHEEILKGLGNLIGRTVRMDDRTLTSARGKFARLAVEINLREPVATGVFLDDVWQEVEFENLPTLCFECGRVGHEAAACLSTKDNLPELNPTPVAFGFNPTMRSPESTTGGIPKRPEFGPWLTVERNSWKHRKGNLLPQSISTGSGGSVPVKYSKSANPAVKGKELETVVPSPIASRPAAIHATKGIFSGSVNEFGESSKEGKKKSRRRKGSDKAGNEGEKGGTVDDKDANLSKAPHGPVNKSTKPVQVTTQILTEPNEIGSPNTLISDPKSGQPHKLPSNGPLHNIEDAIPDGPVDFSTASFDGALAQSLEFVKISASSTSEDISTIHQFHRGKGPKKKTTPVQQALRDISSTSHKPQSQLRGKKQSKKLLSAVTLTGLEAMIRDSNSIPSLAISDPAAVEMVVERDRPQDVGGFDLNTSSTEIVNMDRGANGCLPTPST
ncbi:hypothetical protein LINGRAHAP2_LOCUS4029 [Linum grandiflorum]